MNKFIIELVWNRESHWCFYKDANDLKSAKKIAINIRDSGDGERVKKVRVINSETDKVLWTG